MNIHHSVTKIEWFLRLFLTVKNMDGADATENTLTKKEKEKNRFARQDLSNTRPRFEGVISSSNIPEKINSIDNEEPEPRDTSTKTKLSPAYRMAERLEVQYEILAEGDGLEFLERVDSGQSVSEFSDELLDVMSSQELLESPEPDTDLTGRGRQVYNNWTGFRDNYLAGDTDHDRLEAIESQIGEKAMPWFLEETSDVEVTLDHYLRNREAARSSYDPGKEFQGIMSALHSYDSSELGDRVRALEVLNDPERYGGQEVPEHIKKEFRNATPLGLLDDKEVLTQDGKALYQRVQADTVYMDR